MSEQVEVQINGGFQRMMQHHRGGQALSDLSEALQKITKAVAETGRPGVITLKLHVKAASAGSEALDIEDVIEVKYPKPPQRHSIFFVDDNWNLTRDNPRQTVLPLKMVEPEPAKQPLVPTPAAQVAS